MSLQIGYVIRNMIVRDNDSAKAVFDESSKLKRNRQPLKKKGKQKIFHQSQPILAHLK